MRTYLLLLFVLLSLFSTAQKDEELVKRRKAVDKWEKIAVKKADHGNVDSMLSLAQYYIYGYEEFYGYPNRFNAVWYLKKAAEKQSVIAACQLGDLYAHPIFCLLDHNIKDQAEYFTALKYFQQASDGGNIDATFELLALMKSGFAGDHDSATINQLYRQISSNKDKLSANTLHIMELAKHKPRTKGKEACSQNDYKTAMDCFMAAYMTNYDAKAAYDIGVLYLKGWDVPQSYIKAEAWFAESSDLGYGGGSYMAGEVYWGAHVGKDNYWYEKAMAQGFPDSTLAQKRLDETNAIKLGIRAQEDAEWEASMEAIRKSRENFEPQTFSKSNTTTQTPANKTNKETDEEMYDKMHKAADQRDAYYREKWGW